MRGVEVTRRYIRRLKVHHASHIDVVGAGQDWVGSAQVHEHVGDLGGRVEGLTRYIERWQALDATQIVVGARQAHQHVGHLGWIEAGDSMLQGQRAAWYGLALCRVRFGP